MLLENGDRIVFIGDSISDFGRARPVGEGLHDGVGTGYVRLFETLFNALYPEMKVWISNTGTGGNNVVDLKNRWQTDVLDLNPAWVSVLIGINDVWRQFDSPAITSRHVLLPLYESTYRELIEKTLPRVKNMILCTPFYMEPNKTDWMRAMMDEYSVTVRKLAGEYKTLFVDTQAVFDRYLKFRHSSYIAWDRVHPNQVGAALIAAEILKALEVDRNLFA